MEEQSLRSVASRAEVSCLGFVDWLSAKVCYGDAVGKMEIEEKQNKPQDLVTLHSCKGCPGEALIHQG